MYRKSKLTLIAQYPRLLNAKGYIGPKSNNVAERYVEKSFQSKKTIADGIAKFWMKLFIQEKM